MTHVSLKNKPKMALNAKKKKKPVTKTIKEKPVEERKKKKVPKVVEEPQEEAEESKSLDQFLETWSDDEDEVDPNESIGEKESNSEDDEDVDEDDASAKRYLSSLQSKDPAFYKFLKQQNDNEILNFDSDEESGAEDDQEKENKYPLHKPEPNTLEIASDESDFEMDSDEDDEDAPRKKPKKYTIDILDAWAEELTSKEVSLDVINSVANAFKDALKTIDEGVMMEGALFNAIVRTCVSYFEPAIVKFLKRTKNFKESPKWSKINKTLKSYTTDLVKLLSSVSDPAVVTVLLKHVHSMVPFYLLIPKSCKFLIKELIKVWSSADEETLRVLAFMNILRLVQRSMKTEEGETFFEIVLKSMYMAYVKNCKFVSPSTRPGIAFMRRSLAELMNLNQEVSYQHAFVYIRQLAIHLRNALTLQKKDIYKSVYNWQFIHSLHLWATLFGTAVSSNSKTVFESLVHPLVQVISGSINLIYISKYYPLRFHLCKMLLNLSKETEKFIPVLSYYTDILHNYNFSTKTKKLSMKPLDFSCILRVSKTQLMENGFKDAAIDQVYAGMVELFSNHSHKISFPELTTPAIYSLKMFIKNCKAINYTKKMKQLLEKITDNSNWIQNRRKRVTFGIGSPEEIRAWEMKTKIDGPPLVKFFNNWKKVKYQETLKAEVKSIETKEDAYDYIPKVNKKKKEKTSNEDDFKGDILAGDDDDDVDDNDRFKLKENHKRKRGESESSEGSVAEPPAKKQLASDIVSNKSTLLNGTSKVEEDSSEEDEDEIEDLNLEDLDSDGAEEDDFDDEEEDGDDESDSD
uniref:Nucleolar complex protein 2 homolog [Bombyx mori] n=1 Tax=Lepeophtheirus salmonis TaxID=72036 RepID=A0A0K2T4P3_LEPSM